MKVPITLQGEPAAARRGGVLEQSLHSLNLRCRADAIPEQIVYDVSSMDLGDLVHAGQLAIPADAELLDNPDEVAAVILTPTLPVEEEPVVIEPVSPGPELVGDKQKEDFPSER